MGWSHRGWCAVGIGHQVSRSEVCIVHCVACCGPRVCVFAYVCGVGGWYALGGLVMCACVWVGVWMSGVGWMFGSMNQQRNRPHLAM